MPSHGRRRDDSVSAPLLRARPDMPVDRSNCIAGEEGRGLARGRHNPMSDHVPIDTRDALRAKFGSATLRTIRRADYKGDRGRLNLRLPTRTLRDLALVKVGKGTDKNAFCEAVIADAARAAVANLQAELSPEAWNVIVALVDSTRR